MTRMTVGVTGAHQQQNLMLELYGGHLNVDK
jgi:hypothetical protein